MDPNNLTPGVLPPQPGQIPPQGQPGAPDPYSFIMNAPHPPRLKLFKPNSFRSRLLLIVGGGMVVIFAFIVVSSLVTRTSKANITALTALVAQQQEIVRVANLGLGGSTDLAIQSWAVTTAQSVGSQQQSLTKYLAERKIVLTKLELASKLDSKTDTDFAAATVDNRFNIVFTEKLRSSLTQYATDLKKNYDSNKGPNIRNMLNDGYKSTVNLLK